MGGIEHGHGGVAVSYTWTVYPRHSNDAMVATGMSDDPAHARACVELVLSGTPDDSAWGLLISLGVTMEICRRTRDSGCWWGPLFPDLTVALHDGQVSDLQRLQRAWGHCYIIWRDGPWWIAERRDNGALVRWDAPAGLQREIEEDHAEKPVPEKYRIGCAGAI